MLYYIGIADLPGEMAHSIQEMRMCEAFANIGEDVTYLHGHAFGESDSVTWDNIADFYGLDTEFSIKTFQNFHGKTGRFTKIGTLSMAGPIAGYVYLKTLLSHLGSDDIIYGRNYYPLYFLTEILRRTPRKNQPKLIYEYHNPINAHFTNRFFNNIDGVVCITEKLANYTVETHNIERDRVFVAPDGVDLSPYDGISQSEARRDLNLPLDENIVMYTGHCYEGKGVETLVEAADSLDALIYVVGGYKEDIERVKHKTSQPGNVVFTGFVEPSEIPLYQLASDVLVAPYTEDSRPWVSPLKLFEYMAAGRPIIASDRKVLQEVLSDGKNALLFEKGDPRALQKTITTVLSSESLQQTLVENIHNSVQKYTWEARARSIIHWIYNK